MKLPWGVVSWNRKVARTTVTKSCLDHSLMKWKQGPIEVPEEDSGCPQTASILQCNWQYVNQCIDESNRGINPNIEQRMVYRTRPVDVQRIPRGTQSMKRSHMVMPRDETLQIDSLRSAEGLKPVWTCVFAFTIGVAPKLNRSYNKRI